MEMPEKLRLSAGGTMKILSALVCSAMLCAASARPQDKTPPRAAQQADPTKRVSPAAPSAKNSGIAPEKEKDIRRLLELVGTKALMAQAMGEMEKATRPELENSLPVGDYREKLIEAFFAKFRQKFDVQKMVDLAVPIYDKYFSLEEVRGLIRFYETPLGQKSVSVLPQLTAELMNEGRQLGEDAARQSMMEALAEHPDLEKQMEDAQKAAQP
jgi:uncharacterized protein